LLLLFSDLAACSAAAAAAGSAAHGAQKEAADGRSSFLADQLVHPLPRRPRRPQARRGLAAPAWLLPPLDEAYFSSYLSNAQLEERMRTLAARCSDMMRLVTVGKSGRGAPILALELADPPGPAAAAPRAAFRYVGNLHGDEPTGRQLLLGLADYVCRERRRDARAGRIASSMRLVLIPSANPDGYERKRRENAAGVDLNRNFPDPVEGPRAAEEAARRSAAGAARAPTPFNLTAITPAQQPETAALMAFTLASGPYVAAAALHEGALVANYPCARAPPPSLIRPSLRPLAAAARSA